MKRETKKAMDAHDRKQDRQQSRRYRKRVLAVRAMVGETAWLEGTPLWRDGRVVWESDRGTVSPNSSIIAVGQRRLGQIAHSPRASRHALGDADGWVAHRFARLNAAKRLLSVTEPDLLVLCSAGSLQQRDPRILQRLAVVLAAEAYCVNMLPASPAQALYSCGSRAVPVLLAAATDFDEPPASRALAAMVLGALRRSRSWVGESAPGFDSDWVGRAYEFGLREGLQTDPALFVALLEGDKSATSATQMVELRENGIGYLPDTGGLRALLHRGVSAARIIELCRACNEIEPLAQRINNYRHLLPEKPVQLRVDKAAELRQERAQTLSDLIEVVHKYVNGAADPAAVRMAMRIAKYLVYGRGEYYTTLGEAALEVLRCGLDLPADLQGQFLRLVHERRDFIWEALDKTDVKYLQPWLGSVHYQYVNQIAEALVKVKDAELVEQALKLNLIYLITNYDLKDPDLYRYAMQLIRAFGPNLRYWSLVGALQKFSTAREARQTLAPLTQTLLQAPESTRGTQFNYFLDEMPSKASDVREKAQRWAQYIPYMMQFLGETPRALPYLMTKAAIEMDKARGDGGLEWFRAFVAALDRRMPADADRDWVSVSLRLSVPMGLALAGDDYSQFQEIALTALSHSFGHNILRIESAIGVLKSFPLLCSALARVFPLQPHRCMDLALKIGLASQLGKEAMSPLGYLEGSVLTGVELPDDWQSLIALAPGVGEAARSYILAQRVRGESDAVPPGVRKAFEQPQRIAHELAFLEQKVAENPDNANLQARVSNLRTRLANDGKLLSEMRVEIDERLGQAGAEAHIACAELKMRECYRVRLQTLTGQLPADLELDDKLVNATLLMSDIDQNRKLLNRLLRGYLRGERRPYEKHPENERFLKGLAQRGVDVDAWLSSGPRKYACQGVSGGKVRLVLERDPLSVLQMGNYFDTCLSFGGINAFSTVANACELNKRVVYAYDGLGRVVGRKLIGINEDGKLIGFYTYSTLGDEEGKALRAIFRHYCADFAQRCGLEMADKGTIPRLFAEAWYDDGATSWSEDEDEKGRHPKSLIGTDRKSEPELAAPVGSGAQVGGAVAAIEVSGQRDILRKASLD